MVLAHAGRPSAVEYRPADVVSQPLIIQDQFADGDKVATRWIGSGTNKGALMGIPPTGKRSTVTGITIDRYQNGKAVESWVNYDALGMFQQLGVIPMLAPAGAKA